MHHQGFWLFALLWQGFLRVATSPLFPDAPPCLRWGCSLCVASKRWTLTAAGALHGFESTTLGQVSRNLDCVADRVISIRSASSRWLSPFSVRMS